MRTVIFPIIVTALLISFSCDQEEKNSSLEEFCSITPDEWECDLIRSDFNPEDIPQGTEDPVAIIKYINRSREFIRHENTALNPSLVLDLYPIDQKDELIDFIKSQQLYSWCIPTYYGETEDYFIITSPCFINNGTFTEEADSLIQDLHSALESIVIRNDYQF